MTEAEWLACTEPGEMMVYMGGKASHRKLRLFAVACCRWLLKLLLDERLRAALEIAEQFADGLCTETELEMGYTNAEAAHLSSANMDEWTPSNNAAGAVLDIATRQFDNRYAMDVCWIVNMVNLGKGSEHQAQLLREMFGNPFQSASILHVWRTATATALAQSIYAERAFDRLPILADALEDAGWTNRDILDHCRQPGEHARGCWVVDLVLGKS